MTKKLVWRLGKLPSVDELLELVRNKVITQDEAKEILFSSETEKERDIKGLEAEIKFLRELVDKLSQSKTEIVKIVETVPYYKRWDWIKPYEVWCDTNIQLLNSGTSVNCLEEFSNIKTF